MAVHILAFAIIIIKYVSGLESKNLGYPYHSAKIIKNLFCNFGKRFVVVFRNAYFCK